VWQLGSAAGMATVRRYMGLLAFRRQPAPEAYRGLLERQRWEELAAQFRAEDFALRAVPTKSSLALALQAGRPYPPGPRAASSAAV